MIDLRLLKIFTEVVKYRFVNVAAEKLKITPSAVSQAISVLEKDLGQKLFERDSRPLSLTTSGRVLFLEGEALLIQAKEVEGRLKRKSDFLPQLRLGLGESVCQTIGPWIISALDQYCGNLSVQTQFTKPLVERMEGERLDVVVAPYDFFPEKDSIRQPFLDEDYLLVLHKDIRLPTTEEMWRDMAASSPYICYNDDSSDLVEAERILRSMDVHVSKRIESATSYMLMGLVSLKKGWTIVPPLNICCGKEFYKNCQFIEIPKIFQRKRTMWVSAGRGKDFEMKFVTNQLREIAKEKLLLEVSNIEPKLISHCCFRED